MSFPEHRSHHKPRLSGDYHSEDRGTWYGGSQRRNWTSGSGDRPNDRPPKEYNRSPSPKRRKPNREDVDSGEFSERRRPVDFKEDNSNNEWRGRSSDASSTSTPRRDFSQPRSNGPSRTNFNGPEYFGRGADRQHSDRGDYNSSRERTDRPDSRESRSAMDTREHRNSETRSEPKSIESRNDTREPYNNNNSNTRSTESNRFEPRGGDFESRPKFEPKNYEPIRSHDSLRTEPAHPRDRIDSRPRIDNRGSDSIRPPYRERPDRIDSRETREPRDLRDSRDTREPRGEPRDIRDSRDNPRDSRDYNRPDNRVDTRPDKRADRPDTRYESRLEPRPDNRQDVRIDKRPDTRPIDRQDTRPIDRQDTRIENRTDSRFDTRQDTRVEARLDTPQDARTETREPRTDRAEPIRSEFRSDRSDRSDLRESRTDIKDYREPRERHSFSDDYPPKRPYHSRNFHGQDSRDSHPQADSTTSFASNNEQQNFASPVPQRSFINRNRDFNPDYRRNDHRDKDRGSLEINQQSPPRAPFHSSRSFSISAPMRQNQFESSYQRRSYQDREFNSSRSYSNQDLRNQSPTSGESHTSPTSNTSSHEKSDFSSQKTSTVDQPNQNPESNHPHNIPASITPAPAPPQESLTPIDPALLYGPLPSKMEILMNIETKEDEIVEVTKQIELLKKERDKIMREVQTPQKSKHKGKNCSLVPGLPISPEFLTAHTDDLIKACYQQNQKLSVRADQVVEAQLWNVEKRAAYKPFLTYLMETSKQFAYLRIAKAKEQAAAKTLEDLPIEAQTAQETTTEVNDQAMQVDPAPTTVADQQPQATSSDSVTDAASSSNATSSSTGPSKPEIEEDCVVADPDFLPDVVAPPAEIDETTFFNAVSAPQPSEFSFYHDNQVFHQQMKDAMITTISNRHAQEHQNTLKAARRHKKATLKWLRQLQVEREEEATRRLLQNKKWLHLAQSGRKFSVRASTKTADDRTSRRKGSSVFDDDEEEYDEERYERTKADIPPMLVFDPNADDLRVSMVDTNGYVEDPKMVDQDIKIDRPWHPDEEDIFVRAFLRYHKNFQKISSFLPGKSLQEVIWFYYTRKNKLDLKRRAQREGFNHLSQLNEMGISGITQNTDPQAASLVHYLGSTVEWVNGASRRGSLRLFEKGTAEKASKGSKSEDPDVDIERSYDNMPVSMSPGLHSPGRASLGTSTETVNRWSQEERDKFKVAYDVHYKDFKAISDIMKTKNAAQCKNYYHNNKKKLGLPACLTKGTGATSDASVASKEVKPETTATTSSSSQLETSTTSNPDSTVVEEVKAEPADVKMKVDEPAQPEDSETPTASRRGVGRVNTSHWTDAEKVLFKEQLALHGKDWKALAANIQSKTMNQIKNFFQNYRVKLKLDDLLPENDRGASSTRGGRGKKRKIKPRGRPKKSGLDLASGESEEEEEGENPEDSDFEEDLQEDSSEPLSAKRKRSDTNPADSALNADDTNENDHYGDSVQDLAEAATEALLALSSSPRRGVTRGRGRGRGRAVTTVLGHPPPTKKRKIEKEESTPASTESTEPSEASLSSFTKSEVLEGTDLAAVDRTSEVTKDVSPSEKKEPIADVTTQASEVAAHVAVEVSTNVTADTERTLEAAREIATASETHPESIKAAPSSTTEVKTETTIVESQKEVTKQEAVEVTVQAATSDPEVQVPNNDTKKDAAMDIDIVPPAPHQSSTDTVSSEQSATPAAPSDTM